MDEYKKQKQSMDQILTERDREIAKLTDEIKKLRVSSENEIKKLRKQLQPATTNYMTEGSERPKNVAFMSSFNRDSLIGAYKTQGSFNDLPQRSRQQTKLN